MNNVNHRADLLGKTILLVNTGSVKKRFILQKIKSLGVKLVVLNKEINWAQAYVDHWIIADTTNHSESLSQVGKFIKEHPEIHLDGVLTFWEDDVLLTSKIVAKFNFIGISYSVAVKARNKYLFRDFCQENSLPSIKYKAIKSAKDIEEVVKEFTFPLVIKPVYGSSSAFVVKIENPEDLKESFHYIKKAISSNIESALADGTEIFVEEYIDGDEVDLDILIQNGRIKFYAISDNAKTREPFFIETDRFTPSHLPTKDQEALIAMADEILEKMGVRHGCLHLEAKSTNKGPMPIEVNLRMGGDEIYSSIKRVWKVDLIEGALKICLGIYLPKITIPENPYRYVIARTLQADNSGILVNLDINPEIKKQYFLEEFEFYKKIGDPVLVPPDGYEYLGWLMVSGDNLLDVQANLEEAIKLINYEVAKFHPASSIGKTSRKNRFSYSALNKDILIRSGKIEKIRRMSIQNQRNLHIGIAGNVYDESSAGSAIELDLTSVGLNIEKILKERGYKVNFFDFNNLSKVFQDLKESDIDLVLNVCERINDSSLLEPHAAAILDTLQIPYTGSNPFTLGLCIDKIRVKKLLNYHKIPTPEWDYIYFLDDEIRSDLKYPLIVKPANSDNSIGITNESVVTDKEQLKKQLEKIIVKMGRPALIEEYIEGDEYDVSIIGSEEDDLRVLPLSRSIFDKLSEGYWHIYPYEAKFLNDPIYKNIIVQRPPVNISKKLEALISEISLDTYNILDCHDYGRVEVRVDKNSNPYILELNPNPSINIDDCVPASAELIGLDYGDFVEEIIRMAIKRYKSHPPYYHLQSNLI